MDFLNLPIVSVFGIENVVLVFSSTENDIFMNIELNGSILEHHIVSMLPYQPYGEGEGDLPWHAAMNVIHIAYVVIMQPLMNAALIEIACRIDSQAVPGASGQ